MEFWDYCSHILDNGQPSLQAVEKDSLLSIARGGPTFVQDLESRLTRVPDFESEVFHEVENLKNIVGSDSIDFEEDISVDELKLYTDEDLVNEAMKIAFQVDQEARTLSDLAEQPCTSGAVERQTVLDPENSASCEPLNGLSSETIHDGCERNHDGENSDANLKKTSNTAENNSKFKNKKTRHRKSGKDKVKLKRKRTMTSNVPENEKRAKESYIDKLEPLVRIRQKQEEDKASVQLHSFNHKKEKSVAVSSGNLETLKCLDSSSWPPQVKFSTTPNYVPIKYPEVVLCVEVYHNKQKIQEILVLGRQPLTELRDKIRCVTDVAMQKAIESKDNDHSEIMYDPSGYFLIEDLFCNDMRDPSAIDYSEPILDWLKNSKGEALAKWDHILSGVGKARKILLGDRPISALPNFRSVNMERTRFCDLGFRLGAGYLYCHQGNCKHDIVFRDMRMIHPDDVQNRAAYPLIVYQLKKILKKCSVCNIYKATKVTCDDKWAGENPCYFCLNCYFLLHYSEEGQLLHKETDFKVFDYIQDYN